MTHQPGRPSDLEAHLVAAARGDVAAFAELYEAVAPTVYGLALRVLGDVDRAEEATRDGMLEVWRTAARFDPSDGSAMSWVVSLAHRIAVDRLRSATARPRHDDVDIVRRVGLPGDEAAGSVSVAHHGEVGRTAVRRPSDDQGPAIELAYFGGHTQSEIAQLLSLPLALVTSRIREGLIDLRPSPQHDQAVEASAG